MLSGLATTVCERLACFGRGAERLLANSLGRRHRIEHVALSGFRTTRRSTATPCSKRRIPAAIPPRQEREELEFEIAFARGLAILCHLSTLVDAYLFGQPVQSSRPR